MDRLDRFRPLLELNVPGLQLIPNFDITMRTSMKMRSTAAVFAVVEHPIALRALLLATRQLEVPAYLLGGGCNTLFATSFFEGVVFALGRNFKELDHAGGNVIRAGASVKLPSLKRFSHECGLMGLEFLERIPGTVGGALAGNAGAGNWGLCDFVQRVIVMTREGFVAPIERGQFRYGYRHSELRDCIVLMADFQLEPLDLEEARRREKEYIDRKGTQPYDIPSSGCIFKNPLDPQSKKLVSAGKVIDEIGMKGYGIRSARIANGHANFFVNEGRTSRGEDFLALISLVRDLVHQRRGIDLELEVNIVGGPLNSAVLV
ncbi:MAG: UDP-N-acetylmuramate dehydrogenase [Candidatus Sumerlaeia bacterium]|nr:UDP-N-acetylmuramate dehydrogenase [Candidatus Sumerlaeia bacterium]